MAENEQPANPNLNVPLVEEQQLLVALNYGRMTSHQGHNNLQIGAMMFGDNHMGDPVFEAFYNSPEHILPLHANADCIRYWAKFFSPMGKFTPTIPIPTEWLPFCTSLLLSPQHYQWIKEFLASQAWGIINRNLLDSIPWEFELPPKCPTQDKLTCDFEETAGNDRRVELLPKKTPEVDT